MRILRVVALFVLIQWTSVGWAAQALPYATGFEKDDDFAIGVYSTGPLSGHPDWSVEGSAAIEEIAAATELAEGQILRILPSGTVDASHPGGDAKTVWLQGAYRTKPQAEDPVVDQLGPSSALMYFNTTQGIKVYNGFSTQANKWEPIGFGVDPSGNTWYRITIKLNFPTVVGQRGTWDIYVNSELKRTGIGFKDTSVSAYSGFRCRSNDTDSGSLDNFYVSEEPPGNIVLPTPTPTETPVPTVTPTPTETPVPTPAPFVDLFFYSVSWTREDSPETPFNETEMNLDRFNNDKVIDWLDVFEYVDSLRSRSEQ